MKYKIANKTKRTKNNSHLQRTHKIKTLAK